MLNTTVLGKYVLHAQIRESDLFVEYRATDTQAGRDVTVAVIREAVPAADFLARFGEVTPNKSPRSLGLIEVGEADGKAVVVREYAQEQTQSDLDFQKQVEEACRAIEQAPSDLSMEDSLVGQTLGGYRLTGRLGQGGMATVYKAYEPALDRYVAVKVLPQFFARDPIFVQRFRREAKAVAQLNHPNIVPIYSFGEAGGITYIAMQFVVGDTLKHERGQQFNFADALRLLLPITRALAYAHQRGIVHRDIKPSNVLIAEGNWPLLADFGLAQMAEGSEKLTASGVGMGTPSYMSPEQGQGEKVDHRTDIYSLGIMLYELVTGDVPFRADTPMAVVIKHISAPMPPPRQVNPNIPDDLEALILKATAKSPADRFQSADEMALAMERVLNNLAAQPAAAKLPPPTFAATQRVASAPAETTTELHVGATPPPVSKNLRRAMPYALGIIGACLLAVVAMRALDVCPPPGPFSPLPWCAGSPNQLPAAGVGQTPLPTSGAAPVAAVPPTVAPTPMITDGTLGDILFQDDFAGVISPRWQFTAGPYLVPWVAEEFEGRSVFHSMPANPPGETSDAEIRGTNWENYAVQFDFRFLKPDQFGNHYFTLGGRLLNCGPTVRAIQQYLAVISPDMGILQKEVCREGSQQQVALSDKNFDAEGWHTLQYILIGNRIQLLIDGKPFIDYTDTQDPLTGGDLWIKTGGRAEMLFDNFKVYEVVPGEGNEASAVPPIEGSQSLCLDGSGSYVEVPYSKSLDLPQALTLEAWVQVPDSPPVFCGPYGLCGFAPIINQGQGFSAAGNYTLFLTPQNLGFVFQPLDSKLMAPAALRPGWNHVAVTHTYGKGRESRLYLNGEPLDGLQWTNDKGGPISGDDPFPFQVSPYYFGMAEPQIAYFAGCLDEIRIWNYVRSQREIQEAMHTELTGTEDGLAGYWKFNDPAGSTVAVDSSPNENDGQLRGNAEFRPSR
jgi:serine/threonine-protein kinase